MIKGEAFDFKGVRTGFEKKTANILSLVKKKIHVLDHWRQNIHTVSREEKLVIRVHTYVPRKKFPVYERVKKNRAVINYPQPFPHPKVK